MKNGSKLIIVVPCYNESEVFENTHLTLQSVINELIVDELISDNSGIFYVDDGSKDDTWEKIAHVCKMEGSGGLKLSRNCGHQVAVIAGLQEVDADAVITIDADLQDDVKAIKEMVIKFNEGFDVVYGVRDDRTTDSFFKRQSAKAFYNLMSKIGVEQINNHADFRLLSRRAKEALLSYKESNLYLRGIVPTIGFKTSIVYYKRLERLAGQSKYPFRKMLALAVQGITSNTVFPLRAIAFIGLLISFTSFLFLIFIILNKLFGNTFPGWASISAGIYFLGGVQMFSIGIIGEYVGKIYIETKKRPRYFIENKYDV
ncbi:glycosyltransferase family 2 protein [Leclercia adecarboxylata]|uniref:glycosyltransferase family 2 protein n=1 Tax=Leclercia adecarboxylata TaxID=83655 RepID=UPI00111AE08B|nr:glycosyltransferase family 2 protein [Leclercia adecarboxylata]QCZ25484.1 glycosyltransferase family 2 protein [Leclercia adecarboxylata]